MNNSNASKGPFSDQEIKSNRDYSFCLNDDIWALDKNNKVYVARVKVLLEDRLISSFLKTLAYFAMNYSGGYVIALNESLKRYLSVTSVSTISEIELINYRATLGVREESYLGSLRTFLRKWHALGYYGVTDEIIELLDGWILKGSLKGDLIKRLDPYKGPLTDIELQGVNEGVVQAFDRSDVALSDMSMVLLVSNTGRRPIQVSQMRVKDILKGRNKQGETTYLLNMPRAKQRSSMFREQFKQFAITKELWIILMAQADNTIRDVGENLDFVVDQSDKLELPLFIDMSELETISSIRNLKEVLKSDRLHIKATRVTEACKLVAKVAQLYSERTGELLELTAKRFRYTVGTRAAREGFGEMVIAELLDHSDNQNAGVYIENIPEHVESLDRAVGQQMGRYAQAFSGVLVDVESDAKRGKDLNSRVKADGGGVGTCGSYGFCGASVPIPCYTCMHFQPWLDGPHEVVYDELVSERQRLLDITGDKQIAAVNDRSILAVGDVIQCCASRKEELSGG